MGIHISTRSGGGIFGKLLFSGFGLFFAGIGFFFVSMSWSGMLETKAMQQWAEIPCTIISSEMQDNGQDYKLVLSYTYSFNGQTFTAGRYGKEKSYTAESVGEIDRIKKGLPPGKHTRCHVNPDNPAEAVLNLPGFSGAFTEIGLTLLFPAFGLLFATLPWLGSRRKAVRPTTPPSKTKQRSGKWFMVLFGLIFTLVGAAVLKPLLITPLQKTHDAKTWKSVPATVISSKVKSHDSDDGTTYSVYIAYRYEIDGQEYLGDRYTFMGGSSSGYDRKAEIVRQYSEGHRFTLFVNPSDPADSVILRDYSLTLLFGLLPLVFIAAGLAVMIGGFRARKAQLDPAQANERVVTLKGPSPAKKVLGTILFAMLWNGFVVLIFKSEAPILFHIIFGFFGIIMILAALHAMLALFNPRPEVEITPGDIHPGTSVAMRWRMHGRSDRIETLGITLQCLKVTTETRRSGGETKTSVVKTPVYETELLHTESRGEIAQGTLQFSIPENERPSVPGNDAGIRWQLIFHGDISRWPDVKQKLPFTVYPAD